ncbi:MAG: 4'-phosphopantetheinyl transferase superfamily protein [Chloroflexi bacterium]|nr:4'-phosphopantetheinyl transferase superfamily protein [Chloroflexota bacterium]
MDVKLPEVEGLLGSLARHELAVAKRFYFPRDRKHFIVTRALLRIILGQYLAIVPGQLRFSYSRNGKPALDGDFGANAFKFNLSHCNGLALYAVTRGREIGVDVERVRDALAYEAIADRFFSPLQAGILRALPRTARREAFFRCWTYKEACLKAMGEGLPALGQLDVCVGPGEPGLLGVKGDSETASRWSLQALAPGPGFVAALAVEGRHWQTRCYQWPGLHRESS